MAHPLVAHLRTTLVAAATLLALPLGAQGVTIDFATDPDFTFRPGSFTSTQSALVSFSAIDGGVMTLRGPGTGEPPNRMLFAFSNGSSFTGGMRMTFTTYIERLSMLWGNDDPRRLGPGAAGVFRLYDGSTLLETIRITANANRFVDQEFSVMGRRFNRLEYQLDQASPTEPNDLAEAIALVRFTVAAPSTVIPEPSTVALLGAGLAVLAVPAHRRRRASR